MKKIKDLKKMNKEEREKKMDELKAELIKAKQSKDKGPKSKEIKKMIARILTLNNQKNMEVKE
ncbi:50S ribosomal protein L29 [Candidatus Woesearchaeota archaeon]|nr:50S ribosomal protein L29 [Candidatus Woesearchaeota archaeon]